MTGVIILITNCLWNVFAGFICTHSEDPAEPLRRHVYETGVCMPIAEVGYKEGGVYICAM